MAPSRGQRRTYLDEEFQTHGEPDGKPFEPTGGFGEFGCDR